MVRKIKKIFFCILCFLIFNIKTNAISTKLTYNPSNGDLTINIEREWMDKKDMSLSYADVDCYLKEHNKDSAYKKTLRFSNKTNSKINDIKSIKDWETGNYICYINVSYSYHTQVYSGTSSIQTKAMYVTNPEGKIEFSHRKFNEDKPKEEIPKEEIPKEEISKDSGPSCGPGASALNKTWSKQECNDAHYDEWRSDWSNSDNCCYLTKRKSTVTSSTTNDKVSSTGTAKTNRILFDENYGRGLECESPTSYLMNGVCAGNVNKGETVNFPSMSDKMYRDGQGKLIGWSKSPNCLNGEIIRDKSYEVNEDVDFYACYKEVVEGDRYVAENHIADGGNADYDCGQAVYIEYCNKEESGEYCYYKNSDGNYRKVYRNRLMSESAALNTCNTKTDEVQSVKDKGWMYPIENGDKFLCGEALYITSCSNSLCNYSKISKFNGSEVEEHGTINETSLVDNTEASTKACKDIKEKESDFDKLKKCNNDDKLAMTGTKTYSNFCYYEEDTKEDIYEEFKKIYLCKNGYIDKSSLYNIDEKKNCNNNGVCINNFSVTCTTSSGIIPTLSVTSGIVQSDGEGIIQVKASAKEGKIVSYYIDENYITPSDSYKWNKVDSNTFTIKSTPGVKYIWVKDSNGNISNGVSGAVFDNFTTSTTLKYLELKDDSGRSYNASRVSYEFNGINSSNYVRLANNLSKDSNVLADGFNPFDMEYKLEVESPTITVYATLTSTDSSYVEGYEPRTVNLKYGINTILIKIRNNEGKIRTYTILVTRSDDRNSDNTLNSISIDKGKIDFNSNVTDYKIEIPSNTENVNVNSVISSDKAKYVSGYEPGNVIITGDTTVKLIKVISQTGSTRTYVLTFIKEGTDYIEKESVQLADLVIPGINIPFESNVANYNVSVDYSYERIDLETVLKKENSSINIYTKKKNNNDYILTSSKGIRLDVGENFIEIIVNDIEGNKSYYRLTIIRKEFGLDISNDTSLKELNVLGHNISFEPSKKEYTVKIKTEKSLVITAIPKSNRAEVFIKGNNELTGFSTVRVKVVAENGEYETYSIDIKKDAFNKTIEIIAVIMGGVIILTGSFIIIMKKKYKDNKEYYEE